MSVKIYKIIKKTAGGFHSWVETNIGIIRKPNNKIKIEPGGYEVPSEFKKEAIEYEEREKILVDKLTPKKKSFWQKIKSIIVNVFKRITNT